MHRSSAVVCAGTMAVAFLTGCTVNEVGRATPDGNTDSSVTTDEPRPPTTSRTAGVDVPPPPKELKLDGIDPCALLTASQRAQLQIDEANPDDGSDSGTIYKGM